MKVDASDARAEKLRDATDGLLRRARRDLGPRENTAVDAMGAFFTLNSLLDLVTVLDTRVRELERRLDAAQRKDGAS